MRDFTPKPELDASIEAKIEAAFRASGLNRNTITDEQIAGLLKTVDLTPEELRYSGEQGIYNMVKAELGKKLFEIISEHMKMPREDIIPCLTAYFDSAEGRA